MVIDTFAGTSAGGLNGTLLATAVARGTDLPPMGAEWTRLASLSADRLLRRDPEHAPSVLDGDYFEREVGRLLSSMTSHEPPCPPQECTLLVTATSLTPHVDAVVLEDGRPSEMVDSRRVYRFLRQLDAAGEEEVDDFEDDERGAVPGWVTRAARASAGYPVAFVPVRQTQALQDHRYPPKLREGLPLLMDGGVLDNAPFGPLVETLRERPVGTPFERVVIYLMPSSSSVTHLADVDTPDVAGVLGRVLTAVREPDQRDDQNLLRTAFRQMSYSRSTPHGLIAEVLGTRQPGLGPPWLSFEGAETAAAALFDVYRVARAEALERDLTAIGRNPKLAPAAAPLFDPAVLPGVPQRLALPEDGWGWGIATATRVLRWWGRALNSLEDTGFAVDTAFSAVDSVGMVLEAATAEERTDEDIPPDASLKARIWAAGVHAGFHFLRGRVRKALRDAARG